MGLAWIQHAHPLSRTVPVIPDVESVREEAVRLFERNNDNGLQVRLDRGRGSEFHALRDFQPGLDPRQIDWKHSARHNKLIVKEFRVEQNQHIVAVLDTGRLMSEPLAGQPRLDRALHADSAPGLCRAEAGRPRPPVRLRQPAAPAQRQRVGRARLSRACSGWRRSWTIPPRRPTSPWASPSWRAISSIVR